MKKNMNKLTILVVFFGLAFAASVQASNVSVSLRYQDTLVLDAVSFELPLPGTVTIMDTEGEERLVNVQSVLGVLIALDEADASFEMSKIQYFVAFESLYLQCITVTLLGSEPCDNWLYAVNGTSPGLGMDAFILTGGEQIYVYFGPSHQVVLSATTISQGASFQATAQNYQYQDNTWVPLTGITIGFTQPDLKNPFSPIEVLLLAVDEQGQISLNLDIPPGDYNVGIKEDFYFPSVQLTVVAPTPTRQSGGGLPQHVHRNLDVKKAMQFLALNQNEDGSFGQGTLFTDWAAIAFGAYGEESPIKEKVKDYLLDDPDPGGFLTDYERRAMALMSLSIDPYSGTKTDYIQKISDGFDGTQFGNPNLVNDDIFALLVLLNAGYEASEGIIAKTLEFILSYQLENGSFVGVDMTAAAVQALALVSSEKGVSDSLLNAKEYLKSQQENSGGFKNVYSTSWVMQAMAALGEPETSFAGNQNTPGDYLYMQQAEDGGVEESDTNTDNRIWATSYAIPAGLSKPWGDILQDFEKPAMQPVEPVAQSLKEELIQGEIAALEVSIDVLSQHIASLAETTRKLGVIELKVLRIAQEVEALRPQVAALYVAYLAKLERPQSKALAQQSSTEVAKSNVLEDGTITFESEATTLKQEDGEQFTAEAALTAQNFFRSSAGQAVLALLVGVILFLVLGGWRVILSLVRRPRTVV